MRWFNLSTKSCSIIVFLDMSITTHSGDFRCVVKNKNPGSLPGLPWKLELESWKPAASTTFWWRHWLLSSFRRNILPICLFQSRTWNFGEREFFQVRDVNPASGCGLRLGRWAQNEGGTLHQGKGNFSPGQTPIKMLLSPIIRYTN